MSKTKSNNKWLLCMLILMQILVALLAYQQFRLSEQMELLEIAYHKNASVVNESRMNNDTRGIRAAIDADNSIRLENLRVEMAHQLETLNTSIRDLEIQISRRLSEQESSFYKIGKKFVIQITILDTEFIKLKIKCIKCMKV